MKKRNKKYNAKAKLIELQRGQVEKILSTKFLAFEPTQCDGVTVYGNDCKQWDITKQAAHALARYEMQWTISCYILIREKNLKDKLICHQVDIHTPCKHEDIQKQIADIHWGFIEEYPHQDLIMTAGWIATKIGCHPTEEQAYRVFDDMGCWREIVAQWQDTSEHVKIKQTA